MAKDEGELTRLFEAYRLACPDPAVSADFMPGIWRKIESRRRFTLALRRWTSGFVTAAAALCIAMAVYVGTITPVDSAVLTTTFVETLETDSYETLAYADLVTPDAFQQADAVPQEGR